MQNVKEYMKKVGQAARAASRIMAQADTATKNRALHEIAAALQSQSAQLLAAPTGWMMLRWTDSR
jgi:glutamate-5-semialdehyde dehydrogenase